MAKNLDKITGVSESRSNTALLILDMISAFDFEDGETLFPKALRAAQNLSKLRDRARSAAVPVLFVNDNFGKWEQDFGEFVRSVRDSEKGSQMIDLIGPERGDYHILKPQRSAFYATPLEVLLLTLNVSDLIITGVTTDICVLFSAHDAYMRGYKLHVPSDCTAAVEDAHHESALEFMARVVYAKTRSSSELKFQTPARSRSGRAA
jgi:nicotinamidase-related amidase